MLFLYNKQLFKNSLNPIAFNFQKKRIRPIMNKVSPVDFQHSATNIVNVPPPATTNNPPQLDLDNEVNRACKICLEEEVVNLDLLYEMKGQDMKGMQLMVPCECSGSVGYVHQKCIKTWIYKQIQNTGKNQAFCEICRAQIYFKMRKQKYCDLKCQNWLLISGCNILTAIVQLFLLVVAILIFRYSLGLSDSSLLRYVLIVIVCILALAFGITVILMIGEAFIKSKKEIGHIYSYQETEELGLRHLKSKTANNLVKTIFSITIPDRHLVRMNGNGNRVANIHSQRKRRNVSNVSLIEINPPNPISNL